MTSSDGKGSKNSPIQATVMPPSRDFVEHVAAIASAKAWRAASQDVAVRRGYRRCFRNVSAYSTGSQQQSHVLAAAVAAGSKLIVTFNLDDCPFQARALGVEAIHPTTSYSTSAISTPGPATRHSSSKRPTSTRGKRLQPSSSGPDWRPGNTYCLILPRRPPWRRTASVPRGRGRA